MMSLILTPFLLIVSVPLSIFAFFTTTFALSTLFFRVCLMYAELAAVLLHNHFIAQTSHSAFFGGDEGESLAQSTRTPATGKAPNPQITPPKTRESSGLEHSGRDYEGIGGWAIPSSEQEDVLWTTMNSRLELPAAKSESRQRHHRRSITSGSDSCVASRPVAALRPRPQVSHSFNAKS
ncbi:MAG: hypothetical protein LQ342_003900 [Letrouitia transgressa]|nr:MAG: hypothetical protein LQ342_003900 [Letrouitia transgressa]